MDLLDAREGRGESPQRVVGVYRVLKPHLVATYERHLAAANPLYEPPTRRILERCIAEERRHVAAGAAVLERLLRDDDSPARAATWERRLYEALAEAGGAAAGGGRGGGGGGGGGGGAPPRPPAVVFRKVPVANRGEIARRVFRACRRLDVKTVAVYSEVDRDAPHVTDADEAVPIGPGPARQSYLSIEAMGTAARRTGADAAHPGYGFLAQNWQVAAACAKAGLTFIGPSPGAIRTMGGKTEGRLVMAAAGVPLVPRSPRPGAEGVRAARLAA